MVTTAELQRRGLRYAVSVDAAATVASLQALDRQGLPYRVEVADGASMASRAALDARGLRYFVPVAVGTTTAAKASLDRQGLRYAVQVDADILPADRRTLEQQGLAYYVKVDSSGNSVATAAGGGLLLTDETNGFATDFTHAVDAERVALKTAGATTYSTVDGFYSNAGTSPKMVYDVAGTLVWSPHNLMLQSSALDSVSWNKGTGTLAVNAIAAPNGAMEADGYILPVGGGTNLFQGNVATTIGATYTLSAYLKNGPLGNNWFHFASVSSTTCRAWFNLATGAKGTSAGSPTSYNITSVGNGWYRCDITFVAGAASTNCYFITDTADGAIGVVNGNGTSASFYSWGAQMNRGTVPTAYLPTTTAARYGLALDYDPVTHAARGMLCEPAATNLALQSQEVSPNLSIEGGTVTSNDQTGPDGLLTADTFTEATTTFNHGGYGAVNSTANADYTVSRFYKMGTRRYASLAWSDGTNGVYAVFDLQSGTVGSSAAFGTGVLNSASMQALPNGWYRCAVSGKHPGTTAYYTQQAATAATITVDTFGRQTFLGTGATLFMGHVQVEAGTVATSPIPTLAATVTRAVDSYNCTAASIGNSGTTGSWWAEMVHNAALAGTPRIIGTAGAASPLYYTAATTPGMLDTTGLTKTTTTIVGSIHKVASAFASGDRAFTADGLAAATDAGATSGLLAPVTLYFGNGSSTPMNGYIRKVRYLPRRPNNAELQSMTGS